MTQTPPDSPPLRGGHLSHKVTPRVWSLLQPLGSGLIEFSLAFPRAGSFSLWKPPFNVTFLTLNPQ